MAEPSVPVALRQYIHYCEEQNDSRGGSPFIAGGKRTYSRKWLVKTKDKELGANVICRAPGILPFAPYATEDGKEWDYQALCVDIRMEDPIDRNDGYHKFVIAEYSTDMPVGGPPAFVGFGAAALGAQAMPWMEPPHIEWDSEVHREARPRDLNGNAYLNSAFVPFKPAPTVEVGRSVLIYERNEQSHDSRKQARYSFAVNSDVFLGEKPGTVQLYPPRAVLSWRGGTSFWRMTYKFRFNSPEIPKPTNSQIQAGTSAPVSAGASIALGVASALATPLRTWQPKYLDAGTMELQTFWAAGPFFSRPVPIVRGSGAITEPVLLDGEGRQLKPNADGTWPEPKYREFTDYLALPFTPLLVSGVGFPG